MSWLVLLFCKAAFTGFCLSGIAVSCIKTSGIKTSQVKELFLATAVKVISIIAILNLLLAPVLVYNFIDRQKTIEYTDGKIPNHTPLFLQLLLLPVILAIIVWVIRLKKLHTKKPVFILLCVAILLIALGLETYKLLSVFNPDYTPDWLNISTRIAWAAIRNTALFTIAVTALMFLNGTFKEDVRR
jgi:hypothetical protein